MRILMYAESLKREGGTEISSLQIAGALAERGHSLDLLYERDGDLRAEYESFCRSVTHSWMTVNKLSPVDAVRLVPAILSGVRRRPEVIYVHRFRDVICARLTATIDAHTGGVPPPRHVPRRDNAPSGELGRPLHRRFPSHPRFLGR